MSSNYMLLYFIGCAFSLVGMLICACLAFYYMGRVEELGANNGWEDEARWWRKNAISLIPYENREDN